MDRKDIVSQYKKRLENELGKEIHQSLALPSSYSDAYKIFKKEQVQIFHPLFEKAVNFSEKVMQIKISQKDIDKIEPSLEMSHINVNPAGVYSLAILAMIFTIIPLAVIGLVAGSLVLILSGLIVGLGLFMYIPMIPKQMFLAWRSRASDQIVTAVLYMIIYMQHTPNLEKSIWFASRHLPPPLSIDFIKILWDVETKKYTTVQESLENYIEKWRGWDDQFIDAIHLIESSLYEPSRDEQRKTLEKAEEVILEGTQDHMMKFAHKLQSPIQTLHMLGIILPVMGMVMLPMVSAFMGQAIKWYYLVLLYNIVLPIAVYVLAVNILTTRPAGSNPTDVFTKLQNKYYRPAFNIIGLRVALPPRIIASIVFVLLSFPSIFYYIFILSTMPAADIRLELFSLRAILFSILLIGAIGISISLYFRYRIKYLLSIKRDIASTEKEFTSAIFQLGNRVGEGIPVELSFSEVIKTMPKSKISNFFRLIDANIRQRGMDLNSAIFDPKSGAINYYPSSIIQSVMHTLVESSKKGPSIVASSMTTISKYLRSVNRVTERLKDLLADTLASMELQVKMFVPVIAGIVVGLSVLTTSILINLGTQLEQLGDTAVGGASTGVGLGILDIFQINDMLPASLFQLVVGIYLIQLTFIISIVISGLVNGRDKIEEEWALAQNLFIGTIIYMIMTALVAVFFSGLVAPIVSGL